MFTGRVSEVGTIAAVGAAGSGICLTLVGPETARHLSPGGSVAVAGVRLTVTSVDESCFTAEIGAETQARSSLRLPLVGRAVNLELPLKTGDPLDGHLVQGHVEGTARVISRRPAAGVEYVWLRPNKRVIHDIVQKGSIAVDGVSLTVSTALAILKLVLGAR